MSAIGPGDWVECVDNSPNDGHVFFHGEEITVGAVYQVADCFVNFWGVPSVALVGHERVRASRDLGTRVGYGVRRFRPVYRPKADFIERLMQPAPELEPA